MEFEEIEYDSLRRSKTDVCLTCDNSLAFSSIFGMMIDDAINVVNYAEAASAGHFCFYELDCITERSCETTSYFPSAAYDQDSIPSELSNGNFIDFE